MADNPEEKNGHHQPDDDLPDIEIGNGNDGDGEDEGGSGGGGVPGLKGLFIQPGGQGSAPSPIQQVIKVSHRDANYLRLTVVSEEDVATHMQIMYQKNWANYGNGMLENCMYSGYQLKCSVDGRLIKNVVEMVTGQRQQMQQEHESRRQRMWQNARNGGGEGGSMGNHSGRMSGAA